jgi:hypothetical protein
MKAGQKRQKREKKKQNKERVEKNRSGKEMELELACWNYGKRQQGPGESSARV